MSDGTEQAPPAFEERLRRLETQNRSLRRMAVLTMAGIAIAMTILIRWVVVRNDGRARFDKVEAKHFVVRDSLGAVRGELGMWGGIVRLVLGGDELKARGIVLGVAPNMSSQLIMKHGDGGPALTLTDSPSIYFDRHLSSGGGAVPLDMYVGIRRTGEPRVLFHDSAGRAVFLDSLLLRR